ncbi:MAG: DUF6549 family protein [Bacteroidaceae bacterium]
MKKFIVISFSFCVFALIISIKSCVTIKSDRNRLLMNQQSLLGRTNYYRTRDSLSAASVERLEFSKKELEKYDMSLKKACDNLRIKINRLQCASTSSTLTKYEITTILRDSIVVRDSVVIDTVKCISYQDSWLSFQGCTRNGTTFDVSIESRDTIFTIVHRVPRKFLFFRFGLKGIRQDVFSRNPHSRIVYTRYLELKK